MIAVRANYTPDALNTVLPHLADNSLLVSMQNGINPPLLQEKVRRGSNHRMAIRMGCRKIAPGHVQTAIRGHLYLGHLHGKTTPQLENLQKILNPVMETEISDNILGVLWSKLTYTCLGYYGSLADASLVTSCADEACRRNLTEFFGEVVAVGTAVGARWIPLAEYNPPDFHPSLPFEKRLAAVNEFAGSWKADDRKGPLRQIPKWPQVRSGFYARLRRPGGRKAQDPDAALPEGIDMIHELEAGHAKTRRAKLRRPTSRRS